VTLTSDFLEVTFARQVSRVQIMSSPNLKFLLLSDCE